MTGADQNSWWKRRWEAFLDNAIFYGVVALGGVVVALVAAVGTKDASLPLWLVVLFGLVQVGTVVAVIILFRRPRGQRRPGGIEVLPTPHPHARLLARLRALDRSLGDLDPNDTIPWGVAETFNMILRDALGACKDGSAIAHIEEYERSGATAYSGYIGDIRPMLAQIEAVLEHEDQ